MLPLAAEHAHPRDARVQFTEEDHTYRVVGVLMGLSVTGLIHTVMPEDFDPVAALAKMKAGSNWPNPKYAEEDDYTGEMIPWSDAKIVATWEADGARASALGTDLHGKLELHFNGLPVGELGEDNQGPFASALAWWASMEARGYRPHRTEMLLYDESASLAGSVDFIARHKDTGRYLVIDWKRCRTDKPGFNRSFGRKMRAPLSHLDAHTRNKWHLQVGVYAALLQDLYGWDVEGTYMVVCHPGNPVAEVHHFPPSSEARELLRARREACAPPERLAPLAAAAAAATAPEPLVPLAPPLSPPPFAYTAPGIVYVNMERVTEAGYLARKAGAAKVELGQLLQAVKRAGGSRDAPWPPGHTVCLLRSSRAGMEVYGHSTAPRLPAG